MPPARTINLSGVDLAAYDICYSNRRGELLCVNAPEKEELKELFTWALAEVEMSS
jgi:hypothetical protein